MFSSLGLFKNISCPYESTCSLEHCLFSHSLPCRAETTPQVLPHSTKHHDDDHDVVSTSPKRRKLNAESADSHKKIPEQRKDITPQRASTQPTKETLPDRKSQQVLEQKLESTIHPKRPISPPPLKRPSAASTSYTSDSPRQKNEALNPRKIPKPPVSHATRTLYLKGLFEKFKDLNAAITDDLKLPENELVSLALDEEEKAATENATVYANVIKNRIMSLKKMTIDQWKLERQDAKARMQQTREKPIVTGLSAARELEVVRHLTADMKRLSQYGFILAAPTELQVEKANGGTDTALGWEVCDRCKSRFQVFPQGQRADGTLTSGGSCCYHPGRVEKASKEGFEGGHRFFRCCNAPAGSSFGCSTAESHVFKVDDAARLASLWQFEEIPENENARAALSFDCEMGYTVNGMELIRLTALSWPEGEPIVDVLVKPFGEILDLNTRFSGVQEGDFDSAVLYGSEPNPEKKPEMVESPIEARRLLYNLCSPSTVLIGHSLENDLNTTRIVHKNIADSAILYPHTRGPPLRFALKRLAKEFLGRDIQLGAEGHDAQEDSKTAGDLVRVKVGAKWKQMEKDGWTFQGDMLVSPMQRMKQMASK